MNPLPITAEELVEELDKSVWKGLPSLEWNDKQLGFHVGQRTLVESLKRRMENVQFIAGNGQVAGI